MAIDGFGFDRIGGSLADNQPFVRHRREIVMPANKAAPATRKSASPAKTGGQATVTLKHLAAELADNHEVPKKQAEAVLGELWP
jgi:hypothetical protein